MQDTSKYQWRTVSTYYDVDTGLEIGKKLSSSYHKTGLIDKRISINHDDRIKTIIIIMGCKKNDFIQQNLF